MDLAGQLDALLYINRAQLEAQREMKEVAEENGHGSPEFHACNLIVLAIGRAFHEQKRAVLNRVLGPE